MADEYRTEVDLVERARTGDRSAQQELWRTHRRWVAAIILAHRPKEIDVDDLMQEVALKLILKIHTLRDPALFRPWMRRTIINICRGTARSLRPTLSLSGGDSYSENGENGLTPVSQDGMPADSVDSHDTADCLLNQALTLPPEYREPLLLRCVRSLSYKEISRILNLPVTTVETRLARARRMLRDEVSDDILADGAT